LQTVSQRVVGDKIAELHDALASLNIRNQEANQMLSESLTCENPKLLEVLLEHIIIQWDDICERLFDELVQEEVKELNHIEY
jgi:hypothetical protein